MAWLWIVTDRAEELVRNFQIPDEIVFSEPSTLDVHIHRANDQTTVPLLVAINLNLSRKQKAQVLRELRRYRESCKHRFYWEGAAVSPMTTFFTLETTRTLNPTDLEDPLTSGQAETHSMNYSALLRKDYRDRVRAIAREKRRYACEGFYIGRTEAMRRLNDSIDRIVHFYRGKACHHPPSILITGETGVGKECVAKALHSRSERAEYVAMNCSGIPPQLLESELFGYVKGAFTGADADRPGKVDFAEEGTLFLDEIGELSPDLQSKLLRFMDRHEYLPLGDHITKLSKAWVICATNRNLTEMVPQGKFREDLLARLELLWLEVPPLRERKQDIQWLVKYFMNVFHVEHGLEKIVDRQLLEWLAAQSWPQNIRQLKNVLHGLYIHTERREEITLDDLALIGPSSARASNSNDYQAVDDLSHRVEQYWQQCHDFHSNVDDRHFDFRVCPAHFAMLKEILMETKSLEVASRRIRNKGFSKGASKGQLNNALGKGERSHNTVFLPLVEFCREEPTLRKLLPTGDSQSH